MAKPKEYRFTIGTHASTQGYKHRFIDHEYFKKVMEWLRTIPHCFDNDEDVELQFTLKIVDKSKGA